MWVFKFDEGGDGKQAIIIYNDGLTLPPLYNISFYIANHVATCYNNCV